MKHPELVSVSCSFDLPSAPLDAGHSLSLVVRFTCEPACDLEGETVELIDEDGQVAGSALLGPFDEDTEGNETCLTGEIPARAGQHAWSIKLAGYRDDELQYEGVTKPLVFDVRAHQTTVLVWDVPTAVVAGKPFTIKAGIKCSSGCSQAHRQLNVVDQEGRLVATAAPSELWPKSEALYFAEVELPAPLSPDEALEWQVHCAATDLVPEAGGEPLPHEPGATSFKVRRVKPAEVRVRVEAWDGKLGVPLPGTRIVMHPYSATTDERGVAEVDVARGHYRLFASRPKYTTFGTPVDVTDDLSTRLELHLAPPPNRE